MFGPHGRSLGSETLAPLWACALVTLATGSGCPGPSRPVGVRPAEPLRTVRDICVLLAVSQSDVRVRVFGRYVIRNRQGEVFSQDVQLPWTIISGDSGVVFGGRPLGNAWIEIVPDPGGAVAVSQQLEAGWSATRQYGGHLRLLAQADGSVKVINVVDLETYVAGVLPGELYPDFQRESFRAQAIAARTYALYEMSTNSRADYDVTATEGSQVYEGMSDTAVYHKACEAAGTTRGLVCTWTSLAGERIFCTYFSSACGGMTQSVADAKTVHNIPPLAGGVRCDFCRIAKGEAYRWMPRRISLAEVMTRIAARYPQVQKLGRLLDVRVTGWTAGDRVGSVALIGEAGDSLELPGENFRLAVGSRFMRSTDCRIRVDGAAVVFEDGKGFGHAMGLCQWGMEGQARLGRTAPQILAYYYPQSHVRRAY
ncbi:MAG: SpoIID/LytB domain-containing protein [Planctomycetota bacterium]